MVSACALAWHQYTHERRRSCIEWGQEGDGVLQPAKRQEMVMALDRAKDPVTCSNLSGIHERINGVGTNLGTPNSAGWESRPL